MTEQERVEEVLHHIDRQLFLEAQAALALASKHITLDEYELHRNAHLEDIISKKDKDGKPMIGIISDDQSLPEYPYWKSENAPMKMRGINAYEDATENMWDDNFRRVIEVK